MWAGSERRRAFHASTLESSGGRVLAWRMSVLMVLASVTFAGIEVLLAHSGASGGLLSSLLLFPVFSVAPFSSFSTELANSDEQQQRGEREPEDENQASAEHVNGDVRGKGGANADVGQGGQDGENIAHDELTAPFSCSSILSQPSLPPEG